MSGVAVERQGEDMFQALTEDTTGATRTVLSRARILWAVAITSIAFIVSACGAGQEAQTAKMPPAIPGVDVDAGPIALRDLLIPFKDGGYSAGSDVPLVVRMVNTGEQPVDLSSVTPGVGGSLTVTAQQIALRSSAATGADGDVPASALVVPAEGHLYLVPGSGPYLVAEHVSAALPEAATVSVRFTFSTGDSVEVDVPMAPAGYQWA